MKNSSALKHSLNVTKDLQEFVLVGSDTLQTYKVKLSTINNVDIAEAVRDVGLRSAQRAGTALLWAEARLGEMLKETSKQGKKDSAKAASLPSSTKKRVHYAEALADNKDIIDEVVKEAEKNKEIPTKKLVLRKINEKKRQTLKAVLKPQKLPEGKFDVIYADPPWLYEHPVSDSRRIENEYPTMKLDDIKNLKVPSADDAVLFLWATAPKIKEALEVMDAWGFTFRTTTVWDKEVIGMGYWFRIQHEMLLIGIKGNFHPPAPQNRVSSVHREKRGGHSRKPEYYYSLIEKMYPNGKYLELFSRNKRDGWTMWGASIEEAVR